MNFTLSAARLPFQVQMLKLASREWHKFIFCGFAVQTHSHVYYKLAKLKINIVCSCKLSRYNIQCAFHRSNQGPVLSKHRTSFFVEEGKINSVLHWLFIKLQTNLNLVFMSIPYLSSQSSFSSFLHGLREQLAPWMLSLYCELTLIASTLSKASWASQHGVQAVCFIHCGSHFSQK